MTLVQWTLVMRFGVRMSLESEELLSNVVIGVKYNGNKEDY